MNGKNSYVQMRSHRTLTHLKTSLSTRSIFCRKAYKIIFRKHADPPTSQDRQIKYGINESELSLYYLLPLVVTHEIQLSMFQFKILHNILSTNLYLYRMNMRDYSSCLVCNENTQTIEHMFITCSSAREFWNQFYKWYTFELLTYFSNTEVLTVRNYSER